MKLKPPRDLEWPIPMEAVLLIAEKEQGPPPKRGVATVAYRCPAGRWTIGLGKTAGVFEGMTCTVRQGWEWLHEEIVERTAQVLGVCKIKPTPNQLGALVSLQYNIGQTHLAGGKIGARRMKMSTVLQRHNQGDFEAAGRAFTLWNKATVDGKLQVLNGLTSRRAAESALYLKPEDDAESQPMPQAVAAESSLASSPISRAGATTAGTGVLVLASEAKEHLGVVGTLVADGKSLIVDTLGIPTGMLLPIVLVVAGGAVLYWRFIQRQQGWS